MNMNLEQLVEARAAEFNQHEHREDGAKVASSLVYGLNLLRDSLYRRMHHDVETVVGMDSMLIPVSEMKTQMLAKEEIDVYLVVESAAAARDYGFAAADDDWYLQWLTRLRLNQASAGVNVQERLAHYGSKTPDDRRLAFTDVLAHALAESRRAPLVLFRLLPLSVHLATALAFGDHPTARQLRSRQVSCLPAIEDCQECRGRPLDNGEQCRTCGNPMWKFRWLTAVD